MMAREEDGAALPRRGLLPSFELAAAWVFSVGGLAALVLDSGKEDIQHRQARTDETDSCFGISAAVSMSLTTSENIECKECPYAVNTA